MKRHLGPHRIGEKPLIAGVLTDFDVVSVSPDRLAPVDVIELRVDMFNSLDPGHIADIFTRARELFRKPLLATVRHISEGGQRSIDDRLGIYRVVAPLSEAVDVEIFSEETMRSVHTLVADTPTVLIGSYHNFEATPDEDFLERVIGKGRQLGADIVKVAVMARSREDVVRLLLLAARHREQGIIALSMGDEGLVSRVVGPLFGSLLTYGYISQPSAPGQMSAAELSDILGRLKIR
jgi:3-dehydroquinate dehydratase-1